MDRKALLGLCSILTMLAWAWRYAARRQREEQITLHPIRYPFLDQLFELFAAVLVCLGLLKMSFWLDSHNWSFPRQMPLISGCLLLAGILFVAISRKMT